jgi:hypothetical protein
MKIFEYNGINNYKHEQEQIKRVETILIKHGKDANLPFMAFLKNANYFNAGIVTKGMNKSWNGEVDLICVSEHHFIIFELKNKKGNVKGQMRKIGKWFIKYHDKEQYMPQNNYFMQCSKMKTYFAQGYFKQERWPQINDEIKVWPHVLLVFQDGSDLSEIEYCPPVTYDIDEYEEILRGITEEHKCFMKEHFHYNEIRKKMEINEGGNIDNELKAILESCNYTYRVKKWLHVVTESGITNILPETGSASFTFNENVVRKIAKDFNLVGSNEYFV